MFVGLRQHLSNRNLAASTRAVEIFVMVSNSSSGSAMCIHLFRLSSFIPSLYLHSDERVLRNQACAAVLRLRAQGLE